MTGDQLRDQIDFEDSLRQGDEIEARWTWSGRYNVAPARVVRVSQKSLRAALAGPHEYERGLGLPAGHVLVLPRVAAVDRWSANNGAFPPASRGGF